VVAILAIVVIDPPGQSTTSEKETEERVKEKEMEKEKRTGLKRVYNWININANQVWKPAYLSTSAVPLSTYGRSMGMFMIAGVGCPGRIQISGPGGRLGR
jgi:hypothetical protein